LTEFLSASGKNKIYLVFLSLIRNFAPQKALLRLAAGVSERMGERKVRAAQDAPLLKVEAVGDGWSGEKRTTAP